MRHLNRAARIAFALVIPLVIAVPALIRAHGLSPANVVVAQFVILIGCLALGELVFVPATPGRIALRVICTVIYTIVMLAALAYASLWVDGAIFGNVL